MNILDKKHERLLRYWARRFASSGVELSDLMQEGRIALWRASLNWDGRAALWTYAHRFVRAKMRDFAMRWRRDAGMACAVALPPDNPIGLGVSAPGVVTREAIEKVRSISSDQPSPFEALELKEIKRIVRRFPPSAALRWAVQLYFEDGETSEAIAKIVHLSDRSVRRSLCEATEHAKQVA
jgi:RNA polymerase sigma factor (sigma-70 family)